MMRRHLSRWFALSLSLSFASACGGGVKPVGSQGTGTTASTGTSSKSTGASASTGSTGSRTGSQGSAGSSTSAGASTGSGASSAGSTGSGNSTGSASGSTSGSTTGSSTSGGALLTVTTTSLPNGVVGLPYSVSLIAGGGLQPYAWSVLTGALPAGLSLAADGTLSGTPTVAGNASFTVQVVDSSSVAQIATASLGVTVLANSSNLQITTASLPGGTVGSGYTYPFTASGGAGTYHWSLASGALPVGLTISTAGALNGTPTTTGTFVFTVQVSDGSTPQQTALKQFTMAIGTAPLSIVTTSVPNGVIGGAYSVILLANGGTTPYTWSISSGALPAGLALDASTGTISGSPTTAGGVSFTVQVVDSSSPQKLAQMGYSMTIAAASAVFSITTTGLADGVVGVAYSETIQLSGGATPYVWAVSSGTLPGGLTLNASNGVIAGTPSASGNFSFTIKATDSSSPTKITSSPFSINVYAPLQVATASLPGAVVGSSYSATVTASGGFGPYSFSITSGSLPPGLTMDSAGVISGTPTGTGTYGFAVQVTDSANPKQTITSNLSISSTATLVIASSSLPQGVVGAGYSATLIASGGTPSYLWTLASGTLPTGLALGASTGTLSGTPSAAGTYTFSVTVADSSQPGQTASQSFSVVITNPSGLTVVTTSLPGGIAGKAYSSALSAIGGTSPYNWAIAAGALPPGLALNATTGVISGTPSGAGTSSFTVQVTDASAPQQVATAALTLAIAPPLAVTTTALPNGITGTAYSAALSASGGTASYVWSISSGLLPPGLSLNSATGGISGTPSAAGSFGFTVQVVDSSSPQQTASATLTITLAPGLVITTSSLPNGTVGAAYSAAVQVAGGTTPYAWLVSAGALPTGLSLSPSTGILAGTPSATGNFSFTVTVTDASSPAQTQSQAYAVAIKSNGSLTITTGSLPNGAVGMAYASTLAASGGNAPYSWVTSAGVLPPGLSLNAANGAISGTPTGAGGYTFTIAVSDSSSPTQIASQQYTVNIAAQLVIGTSSLPGGVTGSAYSSALSASGGTTPYLWAVSAGALPAGLTLNATTGVISGTPTNTGTANFTVTVVDSGIPQQTASAALVIKVVAPLVVTSLSLPDGFVGSAYSATLSASGGSTPYTWAIVSGSLPAGLTLNSSTGVISGTPSSAGSSSFTVAVVDSSNPALFSTQPLTLLVVSPLSVTTTALPGATVSTPYSATLAAAGGLTPYGWAISAGSLPPGLALTASTGALSGTPTTAGTFTFTVLVTDSSSPAQTASAALSIVVASAGSLTITTTSLPDGINGTSYSATLAATGGTLPYAWALTGGSLPTGLSLGANGVISGTPTADGIFSFTIDASDSSSPKQTSSRTLSITIATSLQITTTSLPNGVVGNSYAATLTASGGLTPYTWALISGALPSGLTLSASGAITGTPTATGTSPFGVQLTDASTPAQVTSASLTITVVNPLRITTNLLPNGTVGSQYSATIAASGGVSPYSFSLSSGALPPGLSLNAVTGAISGSPAVKGTYTFTILVTDSETPQQQATKQFNLRVQ